MVEVIATSYTAFWIVVALSFVLVLAVAKLLD